MMPTVVNSGMLLTGGYTKVITGLEESKSYSLSNSPVKVDAPTHEKENGIAVLFLGWLTEDNSKKIYGAGGQRGSRASFQAR